jgi:hypothetical protein
MLLLTSFTIAEQEIPWLLQWWQFLGTLALALTISKSQGLSMEIVRIDLFDLI